MEQFITVSVNFEKPLPYICYVFDFWVNFKDRSSYLDWTNKVTSRNCDKIGG